MSKILAQCLLIYLLISPTTLLAKQLLKIGVGNFPPFFVEKGNKGIFIEITNEIFKQLPEYTVKYIFMSNTRLLYEINSGKRIDVACNVFSGSEVNAYLSETIFRFRDVAISKRSSQLVVNKISDLNGKSIAAYQGAKELLGGEFKKRDTTYLMLSDRKDIRVGDINIFWHDLKNKHYEEFTEVDVNQFKIHSLWPDVYSHIAFKEKTLRDSVDKVITELKRSGKIEEIYAKYQVK